jgi:hypothetical protein
LKAAPRPPGGSTPGAVSLRRDAAAKGIIIIAVTVVVGLLIFFKGVQKNDAPVVTASNTTTTLSNTPTTDRNAPPPTTAPNQGTTVPAKTPATKLAPKELKVNVQNGVDPTQTIAGPAAEKLKAAGYQIAGTGDLPGSAVATSTVYYNPDLKGEAVAVAKALGLPDTAVQPMPSPPPVTLNGADVLVVIGKDNA